MNQHFQSQQQLAQSQQANQLPHSHMAEGKPEQFVCTTESVITPPLAQLDTPTLVKTGGIPAAIILSIAVLILALAEYTKVLVPVMLQKPDKKNE